MHGTLSNRANGGTGVMKRYHRLDGQPCFVELEKKKKDNGKGEDNSRMMKQDYVYCKMGNLGKEYGNCGPGFYHLMTKIAYTNLYNKYESEIPTLAGCPSCLVDAEDS